MKDNKLISMVEFVLAKANKELIQKSTATSQLVVEYSRCISYAKFLKQPLTLGMFVPCDEDGNVLEEPVNYEVWYAIERISNNQLIDTYCEQYQQAKERVLFEGFEVSYISNHYSFTWVQTERIDIKIYTKESNKTIETILNHDLILTPNALKQVNQ